MSYLPASSFASLASPDAYPNYLSFVEMRGTVDDCVRGIYTLEQKQRYLPSNSYREKHPRMNQDFLERALFPGETQYALQTYDGLFSVGSPELALPEDGRMTYIADKAGAMGGDMKHVQLRTNNGQMRHGLYCLLLEIGRDDRMGGRPFFFIQEFGADALLRMHFMDVGSERVPDFVLLDESTTDYDVARKQDVIDRRYVVLALDGNGDYFQRTILPEELRDLDVSAPPMDGRTVYPEYLGRRFNRVPFVACGASGITGKIEVPPMLSMAQTEIALFKALADHAYHIYMNTQEILVVTGAGAEFEDKAKNVEVGAGTLINIRSPEAKAYYVSTNGTGFTAEQQQIAQLKDDIDRKRMSLMSAKSHQSGTVVSMLAGAQTAPLRAVVDASGVALTSMLRQMAEWIGYGEEEVRSVQYVPSQQFANASVNLSEYVALCQAVRNGSVPMLERQLYDMARESGILSRTLPYERFKDLYETEQEEFLRKQVVLPQRTGNPFAGRRADMPSAVADGADSAASANQG